ncbi:MAG: TonB-dependent receptor [Deltaproteobacteria bacterium]|nr:TonB-dependent receptor [Deltaproteobacteria bacterium]
MTYLLLALCALAAPSPSTAASERPGTDDRAAPAYEPSESTADLAGLLEAPVVSGASHSAEEARTAPATTTTISAEDLRRFGLRTLDEAIDFLSLGMLTEHALPTVEIGARGVLLSGDYGNHVLLVIDGHAVNEPWGGTAYYDRSAALPLEMIDHIEIILGPGSVLYGSNAMLGVINVITRRAKDYQGLRLVLDSDAPYSLRGAVGGGAQFTVGGVPGEISGQVDYLGFSGPRLTLGPQPYGDDAVTGEPKAYGPQGPFGVWGGEVQRGWYARVPSAHVRASVGSFEALLRAAQSKRAAPAAFGDYDDPESYELDRWLSLDLRFRRALTSRFQLSARGYFDYYLYQQNVPATAPESCLEGQLSGCVYRLEGHSRWGGVALSGAVDWLGNGRLTTTLGTDGVLRYVSSHQEYVDAALGTSPEIAGDHAKLETALALWLEQTARIGSWFSLNLGARYDHDQRFGGHLSPRLAALTAWSGGALKAIYAEAFRAPTAFERYYADPLGAIAAPELRPEVVRSVEVAIEQRIGRHRMLLAGFRTWWRDLVVGDDATAREVAAAQERGELAPGTESASLYRNAAQLDSFGLNLAFDGAALDKLRFGWGLTLAHSRQTTLAGEPRPLDAAAPFFGNARISYDLGGFWPALGLAGRFYSARLVSGSDLDPAPNAPGGAELRLTVSGEVFRIPGLGYRLRGAYRTTDQAPYAIGPLRAPTEGFESIELTPMRRWSVGLGLRYVLL